MAGWGPAGGSQYTIWKPVHQVGGKDGRDGHRDKERRGIAAYGHRQARLEPQALSATGHERMVNGWAAANGEERFDLSAGIVHPVTY
jgi:hypothetical protein